MTKMTCYRTAARWLTAVTFCVLLVPVYAQNSDLADPSKDLTELSTAEQMAQTDASRAIGISKDILEEAKENGNQTIEAAALRVLAIAQYFQADFVGALDSAVAAERLYRDLGDLERQASLLSLMGAIHGSNRQFDRALEVYQRALSVSRQANAGSGEAIVLMNLGKTHLDLGNYDESVLRYEQSIKRFEVLEAADEPIRPDALLFARMGIADALLRQGESDQTIMITEAVLAAADPSGIIYQNALAILGEAHLERGELEQAQAYLTRASNEATRTQRPAKRAETMSLLARLAESQGRYKEAFELQRSVNELNLEIYNKRNSSELARLQARYDSDLQNQQIELQTLQLQRNRSTIVAVSLAAVAALLLSLILFQLYRIKQKSNRALRILAETDPLTGLLNRRSMYECLSEIESDPDKSASTVCLLDLDNFKRVNDQYGHSVGDQLLVSVAKALSRSARSEDRIARWGGEEFLVLLVNRSVEDASEIAKRLCLEVSQLRVDAGGNRIAQVTASVGVAHFSAAIKGSEVIRAADKAMYKAKIDGKNRVRLV